MKLLYTFIFTFFFSNILSARADRLVGVVAVEEEGGVEDARRYHPKVRRAEDGVHCQFPLVLRLLCPYPSKVCSGLIGALRYKNYPRTALHLTGLRSLA